MLRIGTVRRSVPLLFRLAYQNCYPDTRPPAIRLLETAGDFFVQTCYPRSGSTLSVNFGDGSMSAGGARTIQLLLANGLDKEEYRWYLRRRDAGLEDPIGLVYHEGNLADAAPAKLPTAVVYPDIGWVVMRSSWEDDATLLAVKSGFAWNHAHPDAGSFILFHGGEQLIIDSGNCSYGRREYTTYYRHSKAHNVILFNGEAGDPEDCGNGDRGVKTPGSVHRLLDAAGLRYVFVDATGPTDSCNVIHGWETDAYCFAVTRAADTDKIDVDAVDRYFVACGSYLRRGGTVVLGSLLKVFCVFTPGKPLIKIGLQGQPVMNVSLRTSREPRQVILNGTVQPVTYDRVRKTVRLRTPGVTGGGLPTEARSLGRWPEATDHWQCNRQ